MSINQPKGWRRVKLGEILTVSSGSGLNVRQLEGGDYPVYGGNGINGYHSSYFLEEPKLIIGRVGVKCGVPHITKPKSWVTDNALIVEPKTVDFDLKFFQYKLSYENLNKLSVSTAQPVISGSKIYAYEVLLPPLCAQRVIVSKIEELVSELDKGIEQLKTAQQQLKVYRQAVLKYAFEGKLTERWRDENAVNSAHDFLEKISSVRRDTSSKMKQPKRQASATRFKFSKNKDIPSWADATLDGLIYIAARIGWRGLKKAEYVNKGPLFLSVHGLNHGKYVVFKDAYHISEERYYESPEIMLRNDDILLCKDGAGIGKIGIVKNLREKATVNSSLLVIRGLEVFIPEFLFYLLSGPKLQRIVQSRISGSATPHLFQNDIRKFELQVPPIEEQKQIVSEIEIRLSVCDKLEETITNSLLQAESLRQSILKKAFEGRLLSQAELESIQELTKSLATELKIAAEPQVTYKKKNPDVPFPKNVAGIKDTDLHAGILAMVIDAHEKSPEHHMKLSHVKGEKIAHLVEAHIGIDLGRTPRKDAAGPDDFPHLKKVESRATKAGWFGVKKLRVGQTYVSKRGMPKIIQKVKATLLAEDLQRIENLIQTFLPFELEHAEVIATLYAGWNNLLLGGKEPTDEEIVYASRENWSKRKLGIERQDFFKALKWMKEHGFLPEGKGKLVI